ncbi:hypothetical protein BJI67_07940 [Acidihalobacter aeolianus]|uniref:UPF0276 protein BJI67_07940 n=1 Tax=Acidihalobacter aeolianus TaxID=2792603 RepID=A0A1D8K7Q2_9GAMM|nr:DUF692 domain-containing protein [Acidihalobacter aeolianus]AOV16997.1 hypothetical protein BJI67_07940 [Acidihalobacter aeolianus]
MNAPDRQGDVAPIPAQAGIGLRAEYEREILLGGTAAAWLEAHSENYFGPGGRPLRNLRMLAERYPLSLHGVGMGLGNTDPMDDGHLRRLRMLADQVQPALISEHLCWNARGGRHFNDLLPLPYTEEAVAHVAERIGRVQDTLGRQILLENVSSYLEFDASTLREWEFVSAVAESADCGILLDVNNVYVNACNHGYAALDFICALDRRRVREIHLAGHTRREFEDGTVLRIDTHDQPVCAEVWALYRETLELVGPRPTLIEWDAALPPLAVLETEAATAEGLLGEVQDVDIV